MERGRVELLMREAIASVRSGNKNWARECLGKVLRIDPRSEDAWLWMSAVLETASEKKFCLEKVLSINPENQQALQGLQYLEKQARAAAGLPPIHEQTICPMCGEPNDPKAFQCTNCGQDLFVLCPSCEERIDIDQLKCANCGLEVGDSRTGAAYFFHIGELYLQYNRPKRALDAWDKTLFLNPDYPRIAEVAAEAFMANYQYDMAIQSMQRAIEENKDEEHGRLLRLRLANYYRDSGKREEAEKLYEELLQQDQEKRETHADLYTAMGHFYFKDDPEKARNFFEMAVALDEKLYDIHYILAEMLLEHGYEARALDEFRWLKALEGEENQEIAQKAAARVQELRPPVPDSFRNRWQETIRGTTRYLLTGIILLLAGAGRNWAAIGTRDLIAMVAFLLGGYLMTGATTTPGNLPTPDKFAKLGKGKLGMRLQVARKKQEGVAKPGFFSKFMLWQKRSAQSIARSLRVTQVRVAQLLHRILAKLNQWWQKFKASRFAHWLRSLPQTRVFRAIASLGKTRPAQAIALFFRRITSRIFPHRTGPSFLTRLTQTVSGGGKKLIEKAGQTEITEIMLFRIGAAVFGLIFLGVGFRLILF